MVFDRALGVMKRVLASEGCAFDANNAKGKRGIWTARDVRRRVRCVWGCCWLHEQQQQHKYTLHAVMFVFWLPATPT